MTNNEAWQRLRQVIAVFLKLGFTGFGGPAVTIAMMEDEVVRKRQWLTREYFMDLVGATNLIPGPNAAEMAIHLGYLRAGWVGFLAAGACFIVPAALITTLLAWAYVRFGALPQVAPFLYGIKPAVLAVIVGAFWRLGKTAIKGWRLAVLGAVVLLASLLGLNEIVALLGGGILGMLWLRVLALRRPPSPGKTGGGAAGGLFLSAAPEGIKPLKAALASLLGGGLAASALAAQVSLWQIGLFFLKIGAVLYGSGYVLVAFLEGGLVHDLGWLTQQQLLDAIAAGQFTPGPLLSTAAFVGYLLRGMPGAAVATLAVFLPSFVFVALLSRWVPRLRRSPWSAAFLDAVNVCSLALMAAVTLRLAQATLTRWPAWIIALVAIGVTLRWKVNPTWLVLGGALAGWLLRAG
jgi:chromate transporter